MNTLNKIIKQTKKSKIDRAGKSDIMEKLTKDMSKLVLIATQAVTEKVTTIIRQIPIYTANNSIPSSKQIGG
jgi:predicted nucleic acid-binding protein